MPHRKRSQFLTYFCLVLQFSIPLAGEVYDTHAIDVTPISPMSFLASPHFLIGLAADQILPHQCLLCGKFFIDRGVCAACWAGARPISAPLCDHCGQHLPHALPDQLCGQCWRTPPPLAAIRTGFVYNAFSQALILQFKHADGLYLTHVLGQFLARDFAA